MGKPRKGRAQPGAVGSLPQHLLHLGVGGIRSNKAAQKPALGSQKGRRGGRFAPGVCKAAAGQKLCLVRTGKHRASGQRIQQAARAMGAGQGTGHQQDDRPPQLRQCDRGLRAQAKRRLDLIGGFCRLFHGNRQMRPCHACKRPDRTAQRADGRQAGHVKHHGRVASRGALFIRARSSAPGVSWRAIQ
jgi:hypothetical protein